MILGGAGQGFISALVTGVFSVMLFWLTNRRREKTLGNAWQTQANELIRAITHQFESQISYLEGQVAAKDVSLQRQQEALMRQAGMLLGERAAEPPIDPGSVRHDHRN